nr:hypothetical protein [Porphyromonas gulae]
MPSSGTNLPRIAGRFISIPVGSRAEIISLIVPQNAARKLFCFGARSEKFSRQNEKNLAPFFRKTRTTIGSFLVRVSFITGCRPGYRINGKL